METAQHMQDPSPLCINSHVPVACPSCPLSKAATTVGWKFHIIIEVAEGSPVCHIQLYMPTLPPALRSLAAWITCKYLPMACKANSPHLPSPSEPLSLCPAILRHVTPDRPSSGSPRSPHPCSGTAHHSIRECPHVRLLWALVTGHYRTAPTTLPSLPQATNFSPFSLPLLSSPFTLIHTAIPPRSLERPLPTPPVTVLQKLGC
jgi:hypothetical protein